MRLLSTNDDMPKNIEDYYLLYFPEIGGEGGDGKGRGRRVNCLIFKLLLYLKEKIRNWY